MSTPRVRLELETILERCQYIREDAHGLTAESFIENRIPRQAIERNLGKLAVSASRIRDLDLILYIELDLLESAMIVGNQLLNGYGDDIDMLVVWNFVANTNDQLADQVRAIL